MFPRFVRVNQKATKSFEEFVLLNCHLNHLKENPYIRYIFSKDALGFRHFLHQVKFYCSNIFPLNFIGISFRLNNRYGIK